MVFQSCAHKDWMKKQMPLNIMKEESLTYTKTTFALQKDKNIFTTHVSNIFNIWFSNHVLIRRSRNNHHPQFTILKHLWYTVGENIIATTKIRNNYVAIQSFIFPILNFSLLLLITLNPFCILFGISSLLLFWWLSL